MARTGFTNAFVNKPITKGFSYHGIEMNCNKQTSPVPNKDYPISTGAKWILKDTAQVTGYAHSMTISASHYSLLPSSEDLFSACSYPDHKARYRYTLIKAYRWLNYTMWFYNYSAFTCLENDLYWNDSYVEYGYLDCKPYLAIQELGVYYCKIPSKIEVFGSDTGELPSGIPNWI